MSGPPAAGAQGSAAPLAIFCGGGSLPFAVAELTRRRGREVVLFALRGWADKDKVAEYTHEWGGLGQFGRFCRFAREHGCRDVVFIGSVVRPSIWRSWPDLKALFLLPQIAAAFRGGDDHLLSRLGLIFEQHGFRILGAHEVAPEILVPEGTFGHRAPTERDLADAARGLALLNATGPFDIGQAAVVAGNHVLAIEASEGTDEMLRRVAELRRSGRIGVPVGTGVLVKAPKPGQDRRFDLPTIGPQTVAGVARAGLAGVAVVAGSTIVAEPARIVAAADAADVFVVGMRESEAS